MVDIIKLERVCSIEEFWKSLNFSPSRFDKTKDGRGWKNMDLGALYGFPPNTFQYSAAYSNIQVMDTVNYIATKNIDEEYDDTTKERAFEHLKRLVEEIENHKVWLEELFNKPEYAKALNLGMQIVKEKTGKEDILKEYGIRDFIFLSHQYIMSYKDTKLMLDFYILPAFFNEDYWKKHNLRPDLITLMTRFLNKKGVAPMEVKDKDCFKVIDMLTNPDPQKNFAYWLSIRDILGKHVNVDYAGGIFDVVNGGIQLKEGTFTHDDFERMQAITENGVIKFDNPQELDAMLGLLLS